MRLAFRVRDPEERDKSVFSFLGIAFIVSKLCCLAGVTSAADKVLFEATVLGLFQVPSKALTFMEQTFEVGERGMGLVGRLQHYKHVSGQPLFVRAGEMRSFFNPKELVTEWMSRLLCVRDGVCLKAGSSGGRGGLRSAEVDALAERLLSPTLTSQALKAGCVVQYHRDSERASATSMAAARLAFTWSFRMDDDPKIVALMNALRPVLLKNPPHHLTRTTMAPRRVAGTTAMQQAEVTSVSGGEVGSCTATIPASGAETRAALGSHPGDMAGGEPSASSAGFKRKRSGGSPSGRCNLPKTSTLGNQRIAAVKHARTKAPAKACRCSTVPTVVADPSWLVMEVRRTGSSTLLGVAVGIQLPWTLDVVDTARLPINYTLYEVASSNPASGRRQYSLFIQQSDVSAISVQGDFPVVTQSSAVPGNFKSNDLAAAVEHLCAAVVSDVAHKRSAATAVDDGAGCGNSGLVAKDFASATLSLVTSGDSRTGCSDGEPLVSEMTEVGFTGDSSAAAVVGSGADTASTSEGRTPYSFNIVDATPASPLSQNITILTSSALNPLRNKALRLPGRLVLFFPVYDQVKNPVGVC